MKKLMTLLSLCLSLTLNAQLQTAKPWMGVGIEKDEKGVIITQAIDNTPAKAAGLKSGDIITKIDQLALKEPRQLIQYIQNKGVGNQVTLEVITREKTKRNYQLKLVAKPSSIQALKERTQNKNLIAIVNQMKDLQKNSAKLDPNKNTILMFWATWCPACHQAMPILSQYLEEHKEKVQIVYISDEDEKKLKKHIYKLKKQDTTLSQIILKKGNPKKINTDFGIEVLPSFVLLNKKGVGVHASIGVGSNLKDLLNIAVKK